jgi:phage-related protein
MTDTFNWRVNADVSGGGEFINYTSKFGDGYQQSIAAGLNNERLMWTVNYTGSKTTVVAIRDFLRTQKGLTFFWTPPLETTARKFICPKYSLTDHGGAIWTINMQFEQVYAP